MMSQTQIHTKLRALERERYLLTELSTRDEWIKYLHNYMAVALEVLAGTSQEFVNAMFGGAATPGTRVTVSDGDVVGVVMDPVGELVFAVHGYKLGCVIAAEPCSHERWYTQHSTDFEKDFPNFLYGILGNSSTHGKHEQE